MEDTELREVVEDMNARLLAANIAIKALLRASPEACATLRTYLDREPLTRRGLAEHVNDAERTVFLRQLELLLPTAGAPT